VFPTNAVIRKGHSLRVSVGPGDFPHALPPLPQAVSSLGGRVEILHDAQHPSSLTLPTIGESCVVPAAAPAKGKPKRKGKATRAKATSRRAKASKRRAKAKRRRSAPAAAKRRGLVVDGCGALPIPELVRG
jgi:hypothetical protein